MIKHKTYHRRMENHHRRMENHHRTIEWRTLWHHDKAYYDTWSDYNITYIA